MANNNNNEIMMKQLKGLRHKTAVFATKQLVQIPLKITTTA